MAEISHNGNRRFPRVSCYDQRGRNGRNRQPDREKATLDENIVHRGKRVENGFARYSRHSYTTIMIW